MGRTKALIEVGGVPMALRVAHAMRAAGCASVVAYGGDPDELAPLDLDVVPDRYPGAGPLGGVLGALETFDAAAQGASGLLIAACDLPALTGGHLAELVSSALEHPDADVVVARTSFIEPTCAIWRRSSLPTLRRRFDDGERALYAAIARVESVEVDIDASALANINTPDELRVYP